MVSSAGKAGRTALVLSGGGPVAIAWETGMVLGLREGGIDLARADRIIGTSAGSIVSAHLTLLGSVDALYATQSVALPAPERPPDVMRLGAAVMSARMMHRSVPEQNKAIAASAKGVDAGSEETWKARVAERLPATAAAGWPDADLRITATDCESGEVIVWTCDSGVPLPLAVASSCAVPIISPSVGINGRVYMDGGMTSPTNALLAEGCERVIIFDAMARLLGKQGPLEREAAELESSGSRVLKFIFDDEAARLGANLMDVSHLEALARLGREQAKRWLAGDAAGSEVLESLRV